MKFQRLIEPIYLVRISNRKTYLVGAKRSSNLLLRPILRLPHPPLQLPPTHPLSLIPPKPQQHVPAIYAKMVSSASCELAGLSPFVISLMNAMSGSFIMTWKCSMERMDFSFAQFLNQIILDNNKNPSVSQSVSPCVRPSSSSLTNAEIRTNEASFGWKKKWGGGAQKIIERNQPPKGIYDN